MITQISGCARILSGIALLVVTALTVTGPSPAASTFAGNNGMIAFEDSPDSDNVDIFAINSDGSGRTRLTDDPAEDFDPVWSPDGTMIVFTSERKDDDRNLYLMNADGSNQTLLVGDPGQDFRPTWNNDASLIAFRRDSNIYTVHPDGSNLTLIIQLPMTQTDPDYSPNGQNLAFASNDDGDFEIYVANADGSNPIKLTDNTAGDSDPSWSPDGKTIAFDRFEDGNSQIYTMNADGSGQAPLRVSKAYDSSPDWSPDGTTIAFFSEPPDGEESVYLIDADGSNPRFLTFGFGPDWQRIGSLTQGNVDCDKDVDSVDALFELRDVAALPVNQPPGCPEIGGALARGISGQGPPAGEAGASLFGDVDCDDDVDAVDALFILRHVAALPVNQPKGCIEIGATL